MRKNRLGYLFLVILSAILLFAYVLPFFFLLFLFWIGFAVILGILIRYDAKKMQLKLQFKTEEEEKEKFALNLIVETKGFLLASKSVLVELECQNRMFHIHQTRHLMLNLEEKNSIYEIPVSKEQCGEIMVRCQGAYVYDLLGLFRVPISSFGEMTTVIYPQKIHMHVEMSRDIYGRPREEGQIQNRKGNDPSEMFDIREYVPGDDIRSVHWKLSSKTDELILRESSDPSHYNLAVLIDLGLEQDHEPVPSATLNAAIAYGTGIMEKLVRQRVAFCVALPTKTGLKVYEIREERDWHQFCAIWYGIPMQRNAGVGLRLFLREQMEQKFTRLLILTAGKYEQDIKELERRIGITVIGTTQEDCILQTNLGNSLDIVEFPENLNPGEQYRIRC